MKLLTPVILCFIFYLTDGLQNHHEADTRSTNVISTTTIEPFFRRLINLVPLKFLADTIIRIFRRRPAKNHTTIGTSSGTLSWQLHATKSFSKLEKFEEYGRKTNSHSSIIKRGSIGSNFRATDRTIRINELDGTHLSTNFSLKRISVSSKCVQALTLNEAPKFATIIRKLQSQRFQPSASVVEQKYSVVHKSPAIPFSIATNLNEKNSHFTKETSHKTPFISHEKRTSLPTTKISTNQTQFKISSTNKTPLLHPSTKLQYTLKNREFKIELDRNLAFTTRYNKYFNTFSQAIPQKLFDRGTWSRPQQYPHHNTWYSRRLPYTTRGINVQDNFHFRPSEYIPRNDYQRTMSQITRTEFQKHSFETFSSTVRRFPSSSAWRVFHITDMKTAPLSQDHYRTGTLSRTYYPSSDFRRLTTTSSTLSSTGSEFNTTLLTFTFPTFYRWTSRKQGKKTYRPFFELDDKDLAKAYLKRVRLQRAKEWNVELKGSSLTSDGGVSSMVNFIEKDRERIGLDDSASIESSSDERSEADDASFWFYFTNKTKPALYKRYLENRSKRWKMQSLKPPSYYREKMVPLPRLISTEESWMPRLKLFGRYRRRPTTARTDLPLPLTTNYVEIHSTAIPTVPTVKGTVMKHINPYGLLRKIVEYNMIRKAIFRNDSHGQAPPRNHPINQIPPLLNLGITLNQNQMVFTRDSKMEQFTLLGKYRIHDDNKTFECVKPPCEFEKPFKAVPPYHQTGFYQIIQKFRVNENKTIEVIKSPKKKHHTVNGSVASDHRFSTIAVEVRVYPIQRQSSPTTWKDKIEILP